jgi:hypothetical protein
MLGTFTGKPHNVKLKDNVKPHHAWPFPVPKIDKLTLKSNLDCLCALNALKRASGSQWGAPTFIGFIGMIDFHRDMWKNWASLLAPLAALTSKNFPCTWTEERHNQTSDRGRSVAGPSGL